MPIRMTYLSDRPRPFHDTNECPDAHSRESDGMSDSRPSLLLHDHFGEEHLVNPHSLVSSLIPLDALEYPLIQLLSDLVPTSSKDSPLTEDLNLSAVLDARADMTIDLMSSFLAAMRLSGTCAAIC